MKANELTYGCLVKTKKDGKIIKVSSLTKHKIGYHNMPNEPVIHWIRLSEVEPINLEEEILLMNKYRLHCENQYRKEFILNDEYDKYIITVAQSKLYKSNFLTIYIGGNPQIQMYIEKVHQLQNALHMCGLNELAENFKVNNLEENDKFGN